MFRTFLDVPYHIILPLYQPIGWQHGSFHRCALEHSFDLTANAANPKGLAPLRRTPAVQTRRLLNTEQRRRCAWLQQSACSFREVTEQGL